MLISKEALDAKPVDPLRDYYKDRSLRVLVVDDSWQVCLVLRKQLYRMGHLALSVTTEEEASRIMATRSLDLVISDLILGGEQSGLHVLDRAKILCPNASRVLMSAFVSEDEMIYNQRSDIFNACFRKPWNQESLQSAIRVAYPT